MTMGTASTASIAETIGLVLPGGASIPSDANRIRLATQTGPHCEMVWRLHQAKSFPLLL